jgi:hypothetical protein
MNKQNVMRSGTLPEFSGQRCLTLSLKEEPLMENLNELITAAQAILDSGFDISAFMSWKLLAFFTLAAVLGPLHYYTQNLRRLTSDKTPRSLLAGLGLVEAAKAELLKDDNPAKFGQQFLGREMHRIFDKPKYRERLSKLITMRTESCR